MPDPRVSAVLAREGDPAVVAWALDGRGDFATLSDPDLALAAAEAAQNVAALQSVQAPKGARKAASAALHRLKSRGVAVGAPPVPRAFSLAAEEFDLPSRAFLGGPDGDGEAPLVLTASTRSGTCLMEVFLGAPGAHASHGHANRGQLRDVWRQLETDKSLREVPFVVGYRLASDTLVGGGHGWEHFDQHVADDIRVAAKALDLATRAVDAADEAVGDDKLWVLPSRLVAQAAIDLGRDNILSMSGEKNDAWLDEACDRALDGEARAAMAAAADQLAVVLRQLGRMGAAADALRVAASLRDGVDGRSLAPVRNAVQRAVSQAAMRMLQDMMVENEQRTLDMKSYGGGQD